MKPQKKRRRNQRRKIRNQKIVRVKMSFMTKIIKMKTKQIDLKIMIIIKIGKNRVMIYKIVN